VVGNDEDSAFEAPQRRGQRIQRLHLSAYVSIRRRLHTSAYVSTEASALSVCIRLHTSTYVSAAPHADSGAAYLRTYAHTRLKKQ
jgi:hypothetical protein